MLNNFGYNPIPFQPYQYAPQPSFGLAADVKTHASQKRHIFKAPPKKSNALFIKNLHYNMSSDEFMRIFSQFGEIASSSLHIQNRGIAFVTYYDMRSAEAAINGLRDFNVNGRRPVIDFSYKPPNYSKIDPREFSSLVKIKAPSTVSKEDIQSSLSIFGDICEISFIDNEIIKVLFYDFRHAHNACKNGSIVISGIQCQLEVFVENDNSVIYNNKPPSHQKVQLQQQQQAPYCAPPQQYQNNLNYNINASQPPLPLQQPQQNYVCPPYQPSSPPLPQATQFPTYYSSPTHSPIKTDNNSPLILPRQPLESPNMPTILPSQPIPQDSMPQQTQSLLYLPTPALQAYPQMVPPLPMQQQQMQMQMQQQQQQMQPSTDPEALKASLRRLQSLLSKK